MWGYLLRPWKPVFELITDGYKDTQHNSKKTFNIIKACLGTTAIGLQDGKSFLKGHISRATFFLSLRRSDIIIITSPFALRPVTRLLVTTARKPFFFYKDSLLYAMNKISGTETNKKGIRRIIWIL